MSGPNLVKLWPYKWNLSSSQAVHPQSLHYEVQCLQHHSALLEEFNKTVWMYGVCVEQVYTPWCVACEKVNRTFEKLARYVEGVPSLVLARIDASANEHPLLKVCFYYLSCCLLELVVYLPT